MDFEALVREHQGMIFSIAFHLLGDRGAAEDVAQDVLLQLHRDLEALESPAHAVAWLRRVTCHRAIDRGRSSPRWSALGALDEVADLLAPVSEDDPLLARDLQRRVRALPARMRRVLVLRYTEDLGPQEIAQVLDVPLNTVKSLLRRALAQLRDQMQRTLEEIKA